MSRIVEAEEARRLLEGTAILAPFRVGPGLGGSQSPAVLGGERQQHIMAWGVYAGVAHLLAAAPDLAATVIALTAERDRLRDILDCETGRRAPEGWTRNDIDPKREGIAWYRRWEADGSEPGEDDTDTTRVAWVRHDSEADMTTWCWEIEAPTLGVFGKRVAHGEGFALAYEALEACDDYAAIEAANISTKEPA